MWAGHCRRRAILAGVIGCDWRLDEPNGGALRTMSARWVVSTVLLAIFTLAGCAPAAQRTTEAGSAPNTPPVTDPGPLVIFLGNEPTNLATRAFAAKGRGLYTAWRA